MKNSTRLFVQASLIAVVLCGAGAAYSAYKTNRIDAAVARCKAEQQRFKVTHGGGKAAMLIEDLQLAWLTCDPWELYRESQDPSTIMPGGPHADVLTAYKENDNDWPTYAYMLGFLVFFVGAAPAAWYFMLARLAEVAAAIRRN